MTESDNEPNEQERNGTGRVPPLNLTQKELNLARGLIQPEAYVTTSWPDEDVDALQSLNQKLDSAYRSVEADTKQGRD